MRKYKKRCRCSGREAKWRSEEGNSGDGGVLRRDMGKKKRGEIQGALSCQERDRGKKERRELKELLFNI